MIKINSTVFVPEDELLITASRSSGPGGQNVNKVSTKVTLRFDLSGTASLSSKQKERVQEKLKNIINKRGIMVLHDESSRSQAANRKRVIDKFALMLGKALASRKKRIATKASRAKKEQRLEDKKIRARKKGERRRVEAVE